MGCIYKLARPLLFTLAPENAHGVTISSMKRGLFPSFSAIKNKALSQSVCGLTFDNPVGLAAGFDKNAEVIAPILKLGFGFAEAGTVTPKPQDGNPKPRIFRDPANDAVINRMGFPNGGMDEFEGNFKAFLSMRKKPAGVVGINIGMNKTQTEPSKDYAALIKRFARDADYLTINISSPNTPGLRDLQKREPLMELLEKVEAERSLVCSGKDLPPIFVKFAPDLTDEQIDELCGAVIDAKIDGVIVGNTTLDRPDYLSDGFKDEAGGLSGKPLTDKSTQVIAKFYQRLKGKMPIIGVGGISSADDAYAKIKAGATLVQLYTGLIYQGPDIAHSINKGLIKLLKADGYSNISEAIGAAHDA